MSDYEFATCSRCSKLETKESAALKCNACGLACHLTCINSPTAVFLGDAFFTFTCGSCSQSDQDELLRENYMWLNVVILVMYNLHRQYTCHSRRGFFHYKNHVTKIIDEKWKYLFPQRLKKNRTLHAIVSSKLTSNLHIFESGSAALGEQGWWRLLEPDLSPLYLSNLKKPVLTKQTEPTKSTTPVPTTSITIDPTPSFLPKILLEEDEVDIDMEIDPSAIPQKIFDPEPALNILSLFNETCKSEIESQPVTPLEPQESSDSDEVESRQDVLPETKACRPMTQYEEVHLMHRLERAGPLPTSESRRLYRKLVVRNLQRKNGQPLFNLSYSLIGYTFSDPSLTMDPKFDRILDRFSVSNARLKSLGQKNPSFMLRLMGKIEPTTFISPFTERALKPFIMKENCAKFQWIKMMRELMAKANKNNPLWKPRVEETLDYSYVRPQHIPAINSLCRDNFWPGIDVTETLQYPDFSCVALYKKLVVGFAFLVPDTGMNESYISFLFVRPEWRRGGIASFMLYHLIQTCMGKDVTLHVSATNPALILYQRFGFKVEEFVQDFYEKYLPADSRECTHAFFLRLSR
ncbi:cysteine-rich protein 2-binding protein [Neocloeon triangulifer]|uniref:cysteine-rich protein 2-binding protein n=1 Tax=Neocloeon triangulifer TaxID=2078957 RepID=UPI00286EDA92|nr:cysteine-rich protein 2-binding protein [Neocloeon triangulifer]